jgi:hypothetical protein
VAFLAGIASHKTPLMRCDGILVGLDASRLALAIAAQFDHLVRYIEDGIRSLPTQRKIRGGHDFDKVHVIVQVLVRLLLGVIEGIEVVVGPRHALLANAFDDFIGQLGSEAEVVDLVRHGVHHVAGDFLVVLQVVRVHHTVAETLSRREMEVSDDLVDADPAFDPASLFSLEVQVLRVVLPLALLYVLSSSEGP